MEAAIVPALIAAAVGVGLYLIRSRSDVAKGRRDRERAILLEGISQTRAYVAALLFWLSITRNRAGAAAAGDFPNALEYPRQKLSLIGDGPLIQSFIAAAVGYLELPEGGGLTTEQLSQLAALSGMLTSALDEQESRAIADKDIQVVSREWDGRLNSAMPELARRIDAAVKETDRRRRSPVGS